MSVTENLVSDRLEGAIRCVKSELRYSQPTKRILLIALLILTGHVAHAQSFGVTLGGRIDVVPNALGGPEDVAVIPTLGLELGGFVRSENVSFGARLTISSFVLFVWHGQADLYVGYTLPEGMTVYVGAGYGFVAPVLGGGLYEDVHGLLGVRLGNGFFAELTPGIAYARVCTSRTPFAPPPPNEPYISVCNKFEDLRVLIMGVSIGWVWVLG